MLKRIVLVLFAVIVTALHEGCQRTNSLKREDRNLIAYLEKQIAIVRDLPLRLESDDRNLSSVPWESEEDSGGVKIVVKADVFAAFDRLMRRNLGKPYLEGKNDQGYPTNTYHVKQHGFVLSYEMRDGVRRFPDKCVFIILLKPQKMGKRF